MWVVDKGLLMGGTYCWAPVPRTCSPVPLPHLFPSLLAIASVDTARLMRDA